MSIERDVPDLEKHRDEVVKELKEYISSLINSSNSDIRGKADKFSYWLHDYVKYLRYEPQFDPSRLMRYRRGDIIKVNLGYNVGSEEGGLHYAVVVDVNNALKNPVVTIIPLTSLKPHVDPSRLKRGSVFLGNELYGLLKAKLTGHIQHLDSETKAIQQQLSENPERSTDVDLVNRLKQAKEEQKFVKNMYREIKKMKQGSIGLVNQITTVSKIRIYDPKSSYGVLSNIRLSSEKLDTIDDAIKDLYLKK